MRESDAERVRRLEAANRELLARVRVLKEALAPFAAVGRTVTAEEAAGDVWLARARRAADVLEGKQARREAA